MKYGSTHTAGGFDRANASNVTWHDDWRADNARQRMPRIKTPLSETHTNSSGSVQSEGVTCQNYGTNTVQATVQSGAGPK